MRVGRRRGGAGGGPREPGPRPRAAHASPRVLAYGLRVLAGTNRKTLLGTANPCPMSGRDDETYNALRNIGRVGNDSGANREDGGSGATKQSNDRAVSVLLGDRRHIKTKEGRRLRQRSTAPARLYALDARLRIVACTECSARRFSRRREAFSRRVRPFALETLPVAARSILGCGASTRLRRHPRSHSI